MMVENSQGYEIFKDTDLGNPMGLSCMFFTPQGDSNKSVLHLIASPNLYMFKAFKFTLSLKFHKDPMHFA